jgi:hypothetical protein
LRAEVSAPKARLTEATEFFKFSLKEADPVVAIASAGTFRAAPGTVTAAAAATTASRRRLRPRP